MLSDVMHSRMTPELLQSNQHSQFMSDLWEGNMLWLVGR